VYIAAIQAGVSFDIAKSLLIWAIPGALIQFIGGPSRQMGVLLATGLLINNPMAGWAVLIGLGIRIAVLKIKGKYGKNAVIRGLDLQEGATTLERNGQIGGHRA